MRDFVGQTAEPSRDLTENLVGEWTEVDGLRVRFAHAGSGPALVLVHGLLGYSFSWRLVIPGFAAQFEIFAPDMPGSGFSNCDPTLDCRLSSAAKRLGGFLDAVGVGSCDLIGSSYGGATALMLAALAPSRVRRMVLVSPANPWSRIGRIRLALLRNHAVATHFPALARLRPRLHNYFLHRMFGDPRRITPEMYRGYSAVLRRVGVLEHAVKIVQTWNSDMQELEVAVPQVAQIPTLLVWGSRDRAVDPASAEPLGKNFKTAELSIIEGVGHLPYEECPEEFGRIVADFLKPAPASAGLTGK